jgi:hypothetical protein
MAQRTKTAAVGKINVTDNLDPVEASKLETAPSIHPQDLDDHVEEIETRSAAGEALYTIYTDIRRRLR